MQEQSTIGFNNTLKPLLSNQNLRIDFHHLDLQTTERNQNRSRKKPALGMFLSGEDKGLGTVGETLSPNLNNQELRDDFLANSNSLRNYEESES